MKKHEPWRYTCPEGHRSWRPRTTGGYYCAICQQRYHGELHDLKHE